MRVYALCRLKPSYFHQNVAFAPCHAVLASISQSDIVGDSNWHVMGGILRFKCALCNGKCHRLSQKRANYEKIHNRRIYALI